jgi:predicted transcriptional regulator
LADSFSDVIFDLVSSDRLALVTELSVRKRNLTALSKLFKHTVQECSRDLNRLTESGFVRKDSDGLYEITAFGRAMLSQIPSLKFLVRERGYFLSHDLSFLPQGFIERIGELSTGVRVNHTSLVLDHIRAVVLTGKEYVWLISDQMMPRWPGIGSSYTSREIPVRVISEPTIDRKILSETRTALPHSEFATMGNVRVAMAMNETIAGMCFPGLNGKIDFAAGYAGGDPLFRGWCRDLFEHYWLKSEKNPVGF